MLYENAFYKTGLTSLTIPASLKTIYASAFQGCASLASLSLPEGVTSIKDNAFADCTALKSVTIPASLRSMGNDIFSGCSSLTSVTFSPGLTSIGTNMFENCAKLASLTFPSSVTSIGNGAFVGCSSLTSVTIPGTVKSVGGYVFENCTNLASLTLSYGIETMGGSLINGCPKLTTITLPESLTTFGGLSSNSYVTSLVIPSGITSIGSYAFEYCTALKSLTIPSSVTSIGDYAFYNCTGLPSLTIPGSVQTLGGHVFENCSSLVSVNFSSPGLATIGNCAFWNCKKLVNVYFPKGMTSLGNDAFYGCDSLTNVYLPKSITYLWDPFPTTIPWIYVHQDSYAQAYCRPAYERIMGVQLSQASLSIKERTSGQLWSTVVHYNTNRQVSWTSDHPEVATVDQMGKITAIIPGSANITATVIGDEDLTAVCAVEVKPDLPKVTLNAATGALYPDQTLTLTATVLTEDGVDPGVTWTSSDETIATVTDGIITGLKAGTATITATAADGSGRIASCSITVKQYVTGIVLDETSATLHTGDTLALIPTVSPSDASDKNIGWTSSDEKVATVLDGVVTALMAGTANITATATDGSGIYATCDIAVRQYATGLALDKTSETLYTDETLTLTPTVLPEDASDKGVSWASSDEAVATVEDGVVTALKAGTATITAKTTDGSDKSATCAVTVKQYATGVSLDKSTATLYTGDSLTLNATVSPSNTSDKQVTWASNDNAVATVSASGLVTALKAGTATITATTADGSNKSATCEVTVKQYATGLTLDKTSETLYTGETLSLTPTVFPEDASDKGVTWASNDEAVATVSASGVVTAVKAGSATITATASDGSGKSASCQITVKQYATGLALDKSTVTLYTGDSLTLNATVSPSDTSDKQVTWASNDNAVATVSASGVISALKVGSATITASTVDGSEKSASCEITVKQFVTGVALDKTTATLYTGDTLTLTPTVSPDDASDKSLTWASSASAVATVADGIVTAIKAGTATITATAADGSGKSAPCEITVKQYATGVSLDKTTATLYTGDTLTLTPTVSPADASNKGLTWSSDNEAVATVSSSGVVTAHKAGRATITATTADGSNQSAACEIAVKQHVTNVSLDKTSATLYTGETLTLAPTISPEDASDKGLTWSSNNEAVATVADGVVKAKKAGTATITATVADGSGKSAPCEITVKQYATGVSLDKTTATLYTGDTLTLIPTVSPADASDKGLTWSSDNEAVATVSSSGVVTAVKVGSAIITTTTADGSNQSAVCEITVKQHVTNVSLDKTSATLYTTETLTLIPTVSPDDASDKGLTWSSNNEAVATVADGVVTAVKAGSATITVTAADGSGKYAACQITVKQCATGLALDKTSAALYTGGTLTLNATVSPSDTSDKRVTWASDNNAVATVSASGVVTAVKAGSATITAATTDGSNKRASCEITVKQYVTSLTLGKTSATLYPGETLMLTPTISPQDASDKGVTWASSDAAVATVLNGMVTAKKAGTATITATAADGSGKFANCQVTVKQYVSGVLLDKASATVYTGETLTLKATVSPADASNKGVTWASGDLAVATVSSSGVISALKAGSVTITATAADGSGRSAACELTVWTPAATVTVGPVTEALLKPGDQLTLSADVQPADAHDRGATWSTSNSAVARVSGGAVTAVARGAATITATTHNGENGNLRHHRGGPGG